MKYKQGKFTVGGSSQAYRDGWDRIFGKKDPLEEYMTWKSEFDPYDALEHSEASEIYCAWTSKREICQLVDVDPEGVTPCEDLSVIRVNGLPACARHLADRRAENDPEVYKESPL